MSLRLILCKWKYWCVCLDPAQGKALATSLRGFTGFELAKLLLADTLRYRKWCDPLTGGATPGIHDGYSIDRNTKVTLVRIIVTRLTLGRRLRRTSSEKWRKQRLLFAQRDLCRSMAHFNQLTARVIYLSNKYFKQIAFNCNAEFSCGKGSFLSRLISSGELFLGYVRNI